MAPLEVPGPKLTMFPESFGVRLVRHKSGQLLALEVFEASPFSAEIAVPLPHVVQQSEALKELIDEAAQAPPEGDPPSKLHVVGNGKLHVPGRGSKRG